MRHGLLLPAVALLVGATLAGCGDDQPAVCTSIDELGSSLKGLTSLELNGSGVAGLEDQVALVVQDVKTVKDDASAEYDDQVAAIEADLQKVKSDATEVENAPSSTTVAALQTSRDALAADVKSFTKDVRSTC